MRIQNASELLHGSVRIGRTTMVDGSERQQDSSPAPLTRSGRVPRAKRTSVLLVDEMRLTRQCLSHLLHAGARDFEVHGVASCKDVPTELTRKPDVVLFNINAARITDTPVQEQIAILRERAHGAPLVVMSERDDHVAALEAVSQGLRGYVPTSLNVSLLVAAVRLVIAGGTFVPPSAVQDYAEQTARRKSERREDAVVLLGFTEREAAVLAQLERGKANKAIAYDLHVAESTVKVYVRKIMRKLNASNRTEVAFLAQRAAQRQASRPG